MENSTKISLKKIKEAIKQADANIKFEEININSEKVQTEDKTKILRRGNNYDERPLGRLPNTRYKYTKKQIKY